MIRKVLALCFFMSIASWSVAIKGIEIGGMLGGSTYFGELNTVNPIHRIRPGLQVFGRYNFHRQLALRSNISFAMLSGKDALSKYQYQLQRDMVFSSSVISLTSNLELNFLPYKFDSNYSVFSPYLSIGIGATLVNMQFDDRFFNNFMTPFGIGVKLNLSYRWNAGVEYIFNYTFRDDLDRITSHQFGVADYFPFKQRSNSRNNDSYSFFGFYLAYKLKSSVDCPAFSMSHNIMN